jgi:hypothetical protein
MIHRDLWGCLTPLWSPFLLPARQCRLSSPCLTTDHVSAVNKLRDGRASVERRGVGRLQFVYYTKRKRGLISR